MKLRRPKKSEIILIGILVSAIFYTMMLDSKSKRAKAKNRKLREESRSQSKVVPSLADYMKKPRKRPFQFGELDYWGADPFNRPFSRGFAAEKDKKETIEVSDEGLELKGIVLAGQRAFALIGGVICAKGDTLGDFEVEYIKPNKVCLRRINGSKKIILRMH